MEFSVPVQTHFFLVLNNLTRTLDLLQEEQTTAIPTTHEEWHLRILRAFDSGDRQTFFDQWERYLPSELKHGEYEKLEFFCEIYFTCLPLIHRDRQGWDRELIPFKDFLNNKGAEFCKTTEFLPFYALPHIQNPEQHPTFKVYFTENWCNQLKLRLEKYLKNLPFDQPVTDSSELNKAKQREEYLRSALIESNYKWTGFAYNLLNLSNELLKHISGQGDANIPAIKAKLLEYEKFLMSSEDSVSNASSFLPVLQKEHLPTINYLAIKQDIFNLREEVKGCALLQALRWRLTKTPASVRRAVLEEYASNDILKTNENGLSFLLSKGSPRLTDYIAKLANVMTSESQGRSYLLEDSAVIPTLVQVLQKEKNDTILRQNSIGILQKLSLRRKPQSTMIGLEVIEWLAMVLSDHNSLTEYTLEYSSALLMNLSLRTSGKDVCERIEILPLLSSLMEHENPNVRTYVNGTLYSIFSRKSLKENAKLFGFLESLERVFKQSEEAFKKQIYYVLEQLKCEYEDSCYSEDEADEEDPSTNEEDYSEMVSDDEDMDELLDHSGLLGEELLREYAEEAESRITRVEESSLDIGSYIEDRYRQNVTPVSNEFSEFVHAFKPSSKIPRTPPLKEIMS